MELHLSRRHRVRLVGEGALVGLAVGLLIASYRFCLSHAESGMRALTQWLGSNGGAWPLLWVLILCIPCLLIGILMMREPYTQGSGIPQIDAEVAGLIDMPWWRVVPVKFFEGVLCAFSGLSLGREGPSVQLGGMAGKGVSRLLKNDRKRERLLVTCGAAAGMSAAFHAPLTGVLFAIEEIHREFTAPLVISVMSSAVVADFVSSQLLSIQPVIHVIVYESLPHEMYVALLIMGVVCGALGWLHNCGMFLVQDKLFGPLERFHPCVRLVGPFMLAGALAFVWPDLMCGGDAILEHIVNVHATTLGYLVALLVGKYLFTALCFGSGAPGGTLFPLVILGGLVGAIYGDCAMQVLGLPGFYENSFIVLGIAGLFSAVIQAPVTGVVLVFELTGSLEALLATSVVSIVAYVTATLFKTDAFYEHLFARMLGAQKDTDQDSRDVLRGRKTVRNYIVGAGSAADGACVREISWPKDTLVVTVRHAGEKIVPNGATRLVALSEVSVLMDEADEPACDKALKALFRPVE